MPSVTSYLYSAYLFMLHFGPWDIKESLET